MTETSQQHINNVLLLRVLCGKLIPVLDIYASGYITNAKELKELTQFFERLIHKIEAVQAQEDMAGYRQSTPPLYEDFGNGPDNMQRMWQVGRSDFISLVNRLELDWKMFGDKRLTADFKLDNDTDNLLNEIDSAVIRYDKNVKAKMELDKLRQAEDPKLDRLLTVWPTRNKDAQAISDKLKLEQKSYDAANGILNFYGEKIYIIKQPKMRGKDREKNPAKLMRSLFSVNTFPNSVPIREIFPVKSEVYPQNVIKRANSLVARINEGIQEKTPAKNVINHDKFKFFIENQYLK